MPPLYDQLLKLLSDSEFSRLLSPERLDELKNIYKNIPPEKIQEAIDQIKAFEEAFQQSKIQQEQKVNEAAEALHHALQELHQQHLQDLKKQEILSQQADKNILKSLEDNLFTN